MTDGDRERIGRIERRGRLGEAEEQLDHRLHLPFLGASVSHHRLFHFGRRVFHDGHAGFDSGQHRDAAGVAQLQRAAGVDGVKQILDGHDVGTMAREQGAELDVDDSEFFGKGIGGGDRNGAAGDHPMAAAIALHASVAGARRAGIDPKHPHASEASISFSSMSKFDHTCCTSSWSSRASINLTICCAVLPSSFT